MNSRRQTNAVAHRARVTGVSASMEYSKYRKEVVSISWSRLDVRNAMPPKYNSLIDNDKFSSPNKLRRRHTQRWRSKFNMWKHAATRSSSTGLPLAPRACGHCCARRCVVAFEPHRALGRLDAQRRSWRGRAMPPSNRSRVGPATTSSRGCGRVYTMDARLRRIVTARATQPHDARRCDFGARGREGGACVGLSQ